VVVLLLTGVLPDRARADGAFPDESALFFPLSGPNGLVLTTNFGLLTSVDGGIWDYVCEQPLITQPGTNVALYQVADDGTVFAVSSAGLYRSGDGACNWSHSINTSVLDVAADPTQPGTVLAVTNPSAGHGAIVASSDNGVTFGAPIWSGAVFFTGIEFSRSMPGRVYVSGSAVCSSGAIGAPFLVRSDDRGATFHQFDLASLGAVQVRIAQVDPADADVVYLRATVAATGLDYLLTTHNAGATLEVALGLPFPLLMSAFLRAADGTLYVGTRQTDLYELPPGATVWQHGSGGPRFRCLAEQGGQLYGCGDNLVDKMAVGIWQGSAFCPLLQFSQINGMQACANVQTQCAQSWTALVKALNIVGPGDAGAPCLDLVDAGSLAAGGALPSAMAAGCSISEVSDAGPTVDAGPSLDGGEDAGATHPAGSSGCGCHQGAGTAAPTFGLVLAWALRRFRQKRGWAAARALRE
jgi:hypothetical protein